MCISLPPCCLKQSQLWWGCCIPTMVWLCARAATSCLSAHGDATWEDKCTLAFKLLDYAEECTLPLVIMLCIGVAGHLEEIVYYCCPFSFSFSVIKSIPIAAALLQEKLLWLVLKDKLYESGVRAFEAPFRSWMPAVTCLPGVWWNWWNSLWTNR